MNILVLNRSYWPDVEATGQLLTELCSDLAAHHQVAIIAGRPNFLDVSSRHWFSRDQHNGVQILRIAGPRFNKASLLSRCIGLASYFLPAAVVAFTAARPDVIVVETDPPLLGLLGALLKRWHRCGLLYYVQDLYPEVGLALGKLKPGLLTRFLHSATQAGLRAADRIVVLGQDMKAKVLARGVNASKIAIVPNWCDTEVVQPLPFADTCRAEWGLTDAFVVMYSGNLGLSQNVEQVLEAADRLRDLPIEFRIVGDGAAKPRLQALAAELGLSRLQFLPYQPKDQLARSLGTADLHLITLRRGLAGPIVPSKVYGILAAGRPYVAAVDAESEVAWVTAEAHCGVRVEPDDPRALADAIRWCFEHRKTLPAMGARGRALAEARFDRRTCTTAFCHEVEQAAPPPTVTNSPRFPEPATRSAPNVTNPKKTSRNQVEASV